MQRLGSAAAVAAAIMTLVAPLASAAEPQFRNVFSAGQGRNLNSAEALGTFAAGLEPPPVFTSQLPLFRDIIQAAPRLTDADLDKYFKSADFTPATGGAEERPRPGVLIVRDPVHGVPRVYGETRADTMFGSGWAIAQDRLFQMEIQRALSQHRLGELLGPAAVATDEATLRGDLGPVYTAAEVRAMLEQLPMRFGREGALALEDMQAYVEGVNAYIARTREDPSLLPGEFVALNQHPRDWTVVDSAYVELQAYGANNILAAGEEVQNASLLAALTKQLGAKRGREAFEDLRLADDREGVVSAPGRFPSQKLGRPDAKAIAIPDAGSLQPLAVRDGVPPSGRAARTDGQRLARRLVAAQRRPASEHSYAFLVGAKASKSGHPLAVMGPQAGHGAPHPFYHEIELHGPGVDARGLAVAGNGPWVYIGHGRDFAWSGTSGIADGVDTFVERLCEPDNSEPTTASRHYLYRGRCQAFTTSEVSYAADPTLVDQSAPAVVRLTGLRSVHGPVSQVGTVEGAPVAIVRSFVSQASELAGLVQYVRLNGHRIRSGRDFLKSLEDMPHSDSWLYADERDIAYAYTAWAPIRARGIDPDLPVWGTGEWDWRNFDPVRRTYDRLPARRQPHALNPKQGFLLNWNSKPAHGWRTSEGVAYGSVFRVDLIERPLKRALRKGKVSLTEFAKLTQLAATQDLRAIELYPWLRSVIGRETGDGRLDAVLARMDAWRAAGGHRRDLDGDNVYEHSAAVAVMDVWWPRVVRAVLEPTWGDAALDHLDGRASYSARMPDDATDGTTFGRGLFSYIDKDLRTLLGKKVVGRLNFRYCGEGDRSGCRQALVGSLREAEAEVRARHGDDISTWQVAATCEVAEPGEPRNCDQIEFTQSGAAAIAPMPWQNRSTFPQLVEVRRPAQG